jgi:Spx/MgsR family transcriptional regulator
MPSKITLYGIPNCDSVRKVRKWLEQKKIDYQFHDFRKDGLSHADLLRWIEVVDWETLLNRRGTSWRQLSEAQRADLNQARVLDLMLEHPTLIKRPVLEQGKNVWVGVDLERYEAELRA